MKILWGERLTSLWEKIFPPKPLTEEERMRRERIASIEVKTDWDGRTTVWIKDLDRYFRNCPNLERDLKALRSIPLNVPLDDNLQPIDRTKK